jgi:hypothetical protein
MSMLRAHLPGEKDKLLRTIPIVALIDDDLHADVLDVVQPKV